MGRDNCGKDVNVLKKPVSLTILTTMIQTWGQLTVGGC